MGVVEGKGVRKQKENCKGLWPNFSLIAISCTQLVPQNNWAKEFKRSGPHFSPPFSQNPHFIPLSKPSFLPSLKTLISPFPENPHFWPPSKPSFLTSIKTLLSDLHQNPHFSLPSKPSFLPSLKTLISALPQSHHLLPPPLISTPSKPSYPSSLKTLISPFPQNPHFSLPSKFSFLPSLKTLIYHPTPPSFITPPPHFSPPSKNPHFSPPSKNPSFLPSLKTLISPFPQNPHFSPPSKPSFLPSLKTLISHFPLHHFSPASKFPAFVPAKQITILIIIMISSNPIDGNIHPNISSQLKVLLGWCLLPISAASSASDPPRPNALPIVVHCLIYTSMYTICCSHNWVGYGSAVECQYQIHDQNVAGSIPGRRYYR